MERHPWSKQVDYDGNKGNLSTATFFFPRNTGSWLIRGLFRQHETLQVVVGHGVRWPNIMEYLCQLRWTWQDSKVTELPAILWQRGWLWKGAELAMGHCCNYYSNTCVYIYICRYVLCIHVYMYIHICIYFQTCIDGWIDGVCFVHSFVVNGLCVLRSLSIDIFSIYHCRRG